jgi:transcriptional regulator GlxA family with amidase domain
MGMAPQAFSAQLRQHSGTDWRRWLTALRMQRAVRLLEHGTSVHLVAANCGYRSAAAFSRAFHEHFGTAPRDWRTA